MIVLGRRLKVGVAKKFGSYLPNLATSYKYFDRWLADSTQDPKHIQVSRKEHDRKLFLTAGMGIESKLLSNLLQKCEPGPVLESRP